MERNKLQIENMKSFIEYYINLFSNINAKIYIYINLYSCEIFTKMKKKLYYLININYFQI